MLGKTETYQRNKEPRVKTTATSWKREDIQWDLQENHCGGYHEETSQLFYHIRKMRDRTLYRGQPPSGMEKRAMGGR
jgi:hypothetical protein